MQIVKFKYLPYTSLVKCHLRHPIVTNTDVEQDLISFDNSKIAYSRSTGENFRNRTCFTYCVIATIPLWTDEPNERARLGPIRIPTRAETPRDLTLYDGSVSWEHWRGMHATTHHLL